jgi:hypothetical protein
LAVTSIHSVKATVGSAIRYIVDGDKTVDGLYVQSYACRSDSRGASEDFRTVRGRGTGRTQILAHHIIQSFKPNEVTPEQALQIGDELCDKFLKGNYQYVLAVHSDKEHIHCHIIFNNTNLYSGLSFTTEENQGKVSERAWAKLRAISDEICQEHGLSVIAGPEKGQGVSHFERDMQLQGKSWKDKLRVKIAEVVYTSKNLDDFFQKCVENGIEYVYKPYNKVKLKFRMEGQQRFTRADTLGEEYSPERIAEQIEQIQRAKLLMEKYKAPQASVAPTQPIIPTEPKAKPIEKKEIDPWSAIRGMRNIDEMIADLESGGVTSFNELSSFFFNITHNDDHTEVLNALKQKIKAVDILISKMKHRDELAPIYKEYQGKSGWSQSRFRKKNATQIDDYEKTVAFIKARNKPFYVDGKAPKMLDLLDKSNELKTEFNSYVPEHNAFLAKKEVADRYRKQVKRYLDEQHNKRENEKSRQRKIEQQRKKKYLE